jgi:hypothetical protein
LLGKTQKALTYRKKKVRNFHFLRIFPSIFSWKTLKPNFRPEKLKITKSCKHISSRHHPSFYLMVLSTKSDDFYFRVFTSGLLKCVFLELSKKISKFCFRQKNRNIFFHFLSNLYCILKFNLGSLGFWRAKTLKLGCFCSSRKYYCSPKLKNVFLAKNEHYGFCGSCQVWVEWYASFKSLRDLKFD